MDSILELNTKGYSIPIYFFNYVKIYGLHGMQALLILYWDFGIWWT